jgi:hypothetical protein
MDPRRLVLKSLTYYWRTNVAVILGVATAVAVLAGALLVGDSVRGSLRDLLLRQLGRTNRVVVSTGFFREALADDIQHDDRFALQVEAICPLIVVQGQVTDQASGRRRSRVNVYGVDDRFWRFHGLAIPRGLDDRSALVSPALASDIGATAGQTVLVHVERPTDIPIESVHGRKDDRGRTLRLTVGGIAGSAELGEFSLRPQQGDVGAVFVALKRLQHDLALEGRVNTLLVADPQRPARSAAASDPSTSPLQEMVRRHASLADLGLSVRSIDSQGVLAVESAAGVLDEVRSNAASQAAAQTGMKVQPVFTHLANTLRSDSHPGREVPYSLVAAADLDSMFNTTTPMPPPIVINEWTARDLGAKVGDPLTLEYYLWEEPGRLATRTAGFRIAAVVPIHGSAADRDLTPVYPGITDADTLADWDPPFPVDLRRVRHADEDYWHTYRTTPKAFIPFETGQALWRSRYGDRTSVRVVPPEGQSLSQARDGYVARLGAGLDPLASGFSVIDIRAEGLAASRGATDFGAYFTYFSFFLVLSALLLATLFFRLSVEQRARDVGLLRAVGYSTRAVRRLFAAEGLMLAVAGSLTGVAGAVAYAALMMIGLRTWWSGAVGTTPLALHVSAASLVTGAAAIVAAAMLCIWWTLRGLARLSERSLLAGRLADDEPVDPSRRLTPARLGLIGGITFGILGLGLVVSTVVGGLDRTGAFFGAGTSLLAACLCLLAFTLRRHPRSVRGRGFGAMARLGLRNAAERPGRSVLAIGVIASAVFMLISVGAFRREGVAETDRRSGVGGYSLIVELLLPIVYDANSREAHEALALTAADNLRDVAIDAFRLLPGDDASCLNLYQPRNPRVLGVSQRFIGAGRFAFQSSLASTDPERANPWLLLNREIPANGTPTVPVIADANSMTYVLHKQLGDDIVIRRGASEIRLRLVAALADSLFQSELLISDANFRRVFPDEEGFRFLLVEAPPARVPQIAAAIEQGAADLGANVVSTKERLAEFHRVENTYLSTFQMLGGLGLLIGTIGLAAVVMRNVLERRRELALLGAVGYGRAHVFAIILSENALLVGLGLVVGTACAMIAVVPAIMERGGAFSTGAGAGLLVMAVAATGLLSSIIATRVALNAPLLSALRAE